MKRLLLLLLVTMISLYSYSQKGIGFPSKKWGVGFGEPHSKFTGIRFNFYEENNGSTVTNGALILFSSLSQVTTNGVSIGILPFSEETRGLNIGIVSALDRISGININLIAGGAGDAFGVSANGLLSWSGELYGVHVAGLLIHANDIRGVAIAPLIIVRRLP